ncbi:hypothetical protein CRUP_033137 [Coryphaenoides rupestris]|nr:hypothetical protein CRUP_033137 [Coryphaenoides rupestris]
MARPSHSEHVLQQLNNQREWGFLCDCCISIGDIYFRAHKAVLAACSSYFRMMFIRDQQAGGRLDLSNMQMSAECFDLILQLMYLGRIMVGSYEFEELKASMAYLQMYYIPDSLDDLRDLRSSNLTPSSSASSSSSSSSSSSATAAAPAAPAAGKMMFGVRMYEQPRPAAAEPANRPKAPATATTVSVTRPAPPAPAARPAVVLAADEVVLVAASTATTAPPMMVAPSLVIVDSLAEQPCDLRKRSGGMGRSGSLKERPRFGRTYTCDDCGFVFSCEKLLIEHILTCTNRKAFQVPPRVAAEADNDSSKTESSASEGLDDHRVVCKEEWLDDPADAMIRSVAAGTDRSAPVTTTKTISIKTEPEDVLYPEMEAGQQNPPSDRTGGASDSRDTLTEKEEPPEEDPEPGLSQIEDGCCEPFEGHMSSSGDDSGIPLKLRKVKEEKEEDCAPCELCGAELTEEDRSAHYLSSHMGHICACGRCGQVLIKGRQLQEHAERCGESQEAESDSHGEDDSSLMEEEEEAVARGMEEGEEDEEEAAARGLEEEEGLQDPADLACLHCGLVFQSEVFPSTEQLEGHMDIHLYICGVCGEKFRLRKDMRGHYNSKHTKRL